MAFNGGGTNVRGMQGIEQGILKTSHIYIGTPTVSGNASQFTVPAGKKWVLKATQHISSSLIATVSEVKTILNLSTGEIDINLTSGNAKTEFNSTVDIQLVAGDIIELQTQLTAYTSGSLIHRVLYQEIDA